VAASLLLVALSIFYLAQNIRIDTDTEDMLSASLPFRQDAIAIDEAFPSLEDRLLIVIEAPDADRADAAARTLSTRLREQPALFRDVSSNAADPFLDRHGLLYLSLEELNELAARLSAAQPFLGTLRGQPNLGGLAEMVALLGQAGETDPATLDEAARVLNSMADVAAKVRNGENASLSWSALLSPQGSTELAPVRRLITLQPVLDYGSLHPAKAAEKTIFDLAQAAGFAAQGVNVRLTGSAALESEELSSVEEGMAAAGIISLVLVALVLIFGLRSFGAIAALLVTLIAGLIWTATFAIWAVGALNLISVAFAVLFVGLSVDFGIHVYLRATEYAPHGSWAEAIVAGARGISASLTLCAVTSAIAFFSFLPTDYVGLAELGLIAGAGMIIALFANLTLLPALLRLLVKRAPHLAANRKARTRPAKHAKLIVACVAVLSLLSIFAAADARFDFDPMNLRNADGPSMQTLSDIAAEGMVEPYAAEILAADAVEADAIAARLEPLKEVGEVRTITSLVPANQDEKLAVIDDLALFIGPSFFAPAGSVPMEDDALRQATERLRENLLGLAALPVLGKAAIRLESALDDGASPSQREAINAALFETLPAQLERIGTLLEAAPVDIAALPDNWKRAYLADDARARIEVVPAGDKRDTETLEAFVAAVTAIAPNASGAPVIIVEAGKAVLFAFAEALTIAVLLIAVVVYFVVGSALSTLLVFAPVVVAALWTLAVAALADIPFNFANVIVLPLLFGLSVDFGIHIVMRGRAEANETSLAATTTPRAVLLSALTTICSFGAIILSGHPGTASMALLLTISISLTLVAILVFLPALLALIGDRQKGDAS